MLREKRERRKGRACEGREKGRMYEEKGDEERKRVRREKKEGRKVIFGVPIGAQMTTEESCPGRNQYTDRQPATYVHTWMKKRPVCVCWGGGVMLEGMPLSLHGKKNYKAW